MATVASDLFQSRKVKSESAIRTLEALVSKLLSDDGGVLQNTTLYVTGSAARGEMSDHSDLDLFVVRLGDAHSRLDEATIIAAVRRALREMRKPAPSQDGRFLGMQLAEKLVNELGTEKDDFYNHFTARMLLLLESRPLFQGDRTYEALIDRVLSRYWKDAEGRPHDFIPYLLINDIVRYWRILLLNYEAKVAGQGANEGDRRLASYKLRFSRCLLCFSAIAYLIANYRDSRHVEQEVGARLVKLSPLERLDEISRMDPAQSALIGELKDLYATFLTATDHQKSRLVELFGDGDYRKSRSLESRAFGDKIFDLMMALGVDAGRDMLRIVMV